MRKNANKYTNIKEIKLTHKCKYNMKNNCFQMRDDSGLLLEMQKQIWKFKWKRKMENGKWKMEIILTFVHAAFLLPQQSGADENCWHFQSLSQSKFTWKIAQQKAAEIAQIKPDSENCNKSIMQEASLALIELFVFCIFFLFFFREGEILLRLSELSLVMHEQNMWKSDILQCWSTE